jgi:uncharacterized membrane protein YeaQ/YmgE (transglycosylase-associated protein family)
VDILGWTLLVAGLIGFVYGWIASEFAKDLETHYFREKLMYCGLVVMVVGTVISLFAHGYFNL